MTWRTNVVVTDRFEATHAWPSCPHEEVAFLRHSHRHVFHVTVKACVRHYDRDIEFFMMRRKLQDFLRENLDRRDLGSRSCEDMCMEILAFMCAKWPSVFYCSVFEDGENGAELIAEDP